MLKQWERHGVGLFSAFRKEDERLVGRIGYLLWDSERWVTRCTRSSKSLSSSRSAWVVARAFWSQGYAERPLQRAATTRSAHSGGPGHLPDCS